MTIVAGRIEEIVDILGGKAIANEPVKNDLELISLARKGFKKPSIESIATHLGLTTPEVARLLGIPLKDFAGKSNEEVMDVHRSEHLVKLAEVARKGQEVWGKEQYKFNSWLRNAIPALGGQKPLYMMETMLGTEMVLHIIGRIEHGVFS